MQTLKNRDGKSGLNARLLNRIGAAKDDVGRAKALLLEAQTNPRYDPVSLKLRDIANVIQESGKEAGDGEPGDPKGPDADLERFGPNLSALDELIRKYEKFLEASYQESKDNLPIFKRIDREELEQIRLQAELASVEKATGLVTPTAVSMRANEYRLARFYAEGNADLELILGLSKELPRSADGSVKHPRLRLVDDLGMEVSESAKLREDRSSSTPSLLVWRVSTPPLSPGWYTPIVSFEEGATEEEKILGRLKKLGVNFTFSVGSDRPNIQIITGVVQDPKSRSSGTLLAADGPAVVEAQVSAGSSVLGARIQGFYQKFDRDITWIDPKAVPFRDDGTDANGNPPEDLEHFDPGHCDRAANDGIYTAFISLADVKMDTEYRVFVQADTTDGNARYIGLEHPHRDDGRTKGDRTPKDITTRIAQLTSIEEAEGKAMKFQRATSVHFRVVKP